MLRRALAVAVVLLGWGPCAAGEAPAHDAQIEWKVAPDGSLQCVTPPSWANAGFKVQPPVPPAVALADVIWPDGQTSRSIKPMQLSKRHFWHEYMDGIQRIVPHLLHGGLDLASQTDPERHFLKHKMGIADADLIARASQAPPPDLAKPLAERHALDRLLAVRLCGVRKIAQARPALEKLAAAPGGDAFLRDAARQSLALVDGKGPAAAPGGGDDFLLAQAPAAYDILVVFRPTLAAFWKRPWYGEKVSNAELEEHFRKSLKDDADVPNNAWFDMDLVARIDIGTEMSYEIARAFGNARWDRGLLAVSFAPPAAPAAGQGGGDEEGPPPGPVTKMRVIALEGAFLKERLRAQLAVFRPTDAGTFFTCRKDAGGEVFACSAERLVIAAAPQLETGAAASKETAARVEALKKLGADRPAALWVYLRNLAELAKAPPLAFAGRAKHATLALAALPGALELEVAFHCENAEAASAVAAGLQPLLKQAAQALSAPPMAKDKTLASLAAAFGAAAPAVKENTATVVIKVPCTPESALDAFIEVDTKQMREMDDE